MVDVENRGEIIMYLGTLCKHHMESGNNVESH